LNVFGDPGKVLQASLQALRKVVSERQAQAITATPGAAEQNKLTQALAWAALPGHRIMTLADTDYPPALLNIDDPPMLLYVKGRSDLLSACSLAVVGSRNASEQGRRNAEHFSEALSHAGVSIVSGLALGIDTAAHEGGLRGVGASIAVIGTGIDIVYPARNSHLAQRLAQDGCIISEYALGTAPLAANFPRRNRIISGLSRAVLVVEAAAQSGSLITARTAAEQGRDVLAIPGSIHAPLSKGCHCLIKQGAKLVESIDDIVEELGRLPDCSQRSPVTTAHGALPQCEDMLLRALGFDPVGLDGLSARTGLDVAALHAQLLMLELDGLVESLPGGRYRRVN